MFARIDSNCSEVRRKVAGEWMEIIKKQRRRPKEEIKATRGRTRYRRGTRKGTSKRVRVVDRQCHFLKKEKNSGRNRRNKLDVPVTYVDQASRGMFVTGGKEKTDGPARTSAAKKTQSK